MHKQEPTTEMDETPPKWPENLAKGAVSELNTQRRIAGPLVVMNLTWFAKIAVTTAFLGRLGELELAGGTLAFTFANVTGLSVLTGLCGAMDPISGQAHGAKNFKLLHRTLVMTVALLLVTSLCVSFLWLNVDGILLRFGQREDIAAAAKRYLHRLLPILAVDSFLYPLKSYLSSQGSTVPVMLSSVLAVALHVPLNVWLVRAKGFEGVAMGFWITDLVAAAALAVYVLVAEFRRRDGGGWWSQGLDDWRRLLKLCGPCCLTTCLEWWCFEILVLLSGRLPDARRAVGVIAIVLNFDYLLYSVMLSLATCASVRVSNELGAGRALPARRSAYVSLAVGAAAGLIGGLVMALARGPWAALFSHDSGIMHGVKTALLVMAVVEVVNYPLAVCGGIVRGTARPWLAMYSNIGGFYLLALPVGVVLAFKVRMGLVGLLTGFLVGAVACLVLLLVSIVRIDWSEEARKAQKLAGCGSNVVNHMVQNDANNDKTAKTLPYHEHEHEFECVQNV